MRKMLTLGTMTAAALTFGATPAVASGGVTTGSFKAEDMLANEGAYGAMLFYHEPSWQDGAELVIDIAGGAALVATWSAGIAMSVVAAVKGSSQDDQDEDVTGDEATGDDGQGAEQ